MTVHPQTPENPETQESIRQGCYSDAQIAKLGKPQAGDHGDVRRTAGCTCNPAPDEPCWCPAPSDHLVQECAQLARAICRGERALARRATAEYDLRRLASVVERLEGELAEAARMRDHYMLRYNEESGRSASYERILDLVAADDWRARFEAEHAGKIVSTAALSPGPGDVIVATVRDDTSPEIFDSIGKGLNGVWPDHRIVVVPESVTVSAGDLEAATKAIEGLARELRTIRNAEGQRTADEDDGLLRAAEELGSLSGCDDGVSGEPEPMCGCGRQTEAACPCFTPEGYGRVQNEIDAERSTAAPSWEGDSAEEIIGAIDGKAADPERCPVVSTAHGDLPVGTRIDYRPGRTFVLRLPEPGRFGPSVWFEIGGIRDKGGPRMVGRILEPLAHDATGAPIYEGDRVEFTPADGSKSEGTAKPYGGRGCIVRVDDFDTYPFSHAHLRPTVRKVHSPEAKS
jgi:hypothetical protein